VQFNQRQGAEHVNLFELGKVYKPGARAGHAEDERLSLAIALSGRQPANWAAAGRDCDFYDLKATVEGLFSRLGVSGAEVEPGGPEPVYHPGRSGKLLIGKECVGYFGEVHPDLARANEFRDRVLCAELDLERLLALAAAVRTPFRSIPRLPGSERDLAVVVSEDMPAGQLLALARSAAQPVVEEVILLDVYRGEHVDAGKKSLALRLRLRSSEATLNEEQIKEVTDRVLKRLEKECGAVLRS
jgi:phenylalanyl-tRNA synthetase beta chain